MMIDTYEDKEPFEFSAEMLDPCTIELKVLYAEPSSGAEAHTKGRC